MAVIRAMLFILCVLLPTSVSAADNESLAPDRATKTYELPGIDQKALKKIQNAVRLEIEYANDQKCRFEKPDADWSLSDSLLTISVAETCAEDQDLQRIRVYSESKLEIAVLTSIPVGILAGGLVGLSTYPLFFGQEEGEWAGMGRYSFTMCGALAGGVILPLITAIRNPVWRVVYDPEGPDRQDPGHWRW
ncbi:MAG: hypothetical protein KJ970_15395 [Candidatus Eisenbacteria bacterium]|uniref:Uncharacterized protein n=1 Tax=Eiseniibacteriota bacterium TaxID=2212470 RepID=A0A948RZZ7_UNCEI|nr:hypothetical protein [Candidatus Eisenbacteria bacterium]MBU1948176.1 hypothetical protein [Candidatus Eisenbacteria bacterium]MBU2692307.1 hypothetical protein [Candidatus Eisenbacteria bacterium]